MTERTERAGRGRGTLVVGLGNRLRGDDAAGLVAAGMIAERLPSLEVVELEREPSGLLDLWPGVGEAVVIDAVVGIEPGRVHRFDGSVPLPAAFGGGHSTHLLGLPEVIELGRELGRLPGRLLVIGIEGSQFSLGAAMTPAVREAAEAVAVEVAERGVGRPERVQGGQ